jgi:hypothetical protein
MNPALAIGAFDAAVYGQRLVAGPPIDRFGGQAEIWRTAPGFR